MITQGFDWIDHKWFFDLLQLLKQFGVLLGRLNYPKNIYGYTFFNRFD